MWLDLWVIKIKKPMILCARIASAFLVLFTWSRSRIYESFVYSTVIITRFNDYQTRQTHFRGNNEARKDLWAFFLIVLLGRWLAGQANSGHTDHHFTRLSLPLECVLCNKWMLFLYSQLSKGLLLWFCYKHLQEVWRGLLLFCRGKSPVHKVPIRVFYFEGRFQDMHR